MSCPLSKTKMLGYSFLLLLGILEPLYACSYPKDPQIQKQKEQCQGPSKEWNCRLHRCMVKQEVADFRKSFRHCTKIEDPQAKEECYRQTAEKETGVQQGQGPQDGGILEKANLSLSSAYSLLGLIALASKQGGSCTSQKIMMAGSLAHLATHLFVVNSSKKKFKQVSKRIQENKASDDPSLQYQAFEILLEEQKAVKDYAKKKKMTYMIVTATYAGALAMALLEATSSFGMSPCVPSQGPTTEQGAFFAKALSTLGKGVNILMNSSRKVALWAGVGGALSFKLMRGATAQEKAAKSNIAGITLTMEKFQEVLDQHCSQNRDNMQNPRCFCYLPNKKKHPQRKKSAICQKYWKQMEQNFAVAATRYKADSQGRTGCMDINGKFDVTCRCRKFIDAKTKRNACYQTPKRIGIPLPIQGHLSGVNTALKGVDHLTGASLGRGQVGESGLYKAAIKTKRYANKLLKKYNKKAPAQGFAPLKIGPRLVGQTAQKMVTPSIQKRWSSGMGSGIIAKNAKSLPPNIRQSLQEARKKTIQKASPRYTKNKKQIKARGKEQGSFRWGADGPSSQGGGGGTILSMEEAKRTLSSEDSEINAQQYLPIWKMISKRYLLSGIPQLFSERQQQEP